MYAICIMAANMEANMDADDEMEVESENETETETSIGSIEREEQQDLIEQYTTLMLQKIASDPYASVPEIMNMLLLEGPYENKQAIIQVYGGREVLRKTISRMNAVRRAVLSDTLGDLPLETRVQSGEEVGAMTPRIERFIESWAPWKTGGERHHELGLVMEHEYLFEEDPTFDDKASEINRYPHEGDDAEKYLEDTESSMEME